MVAEVAPEAALGGSLALVVGGDTVTIDLNSRRVDLLVVPAELERRHAGRRIQAPPRPDPCTTPPIEW